MQKTRHNIKPVSLAVKIDSTPAQVFRALTSQTELRKWLAPRVITAKNLISYEEEKNIDLRPVQLDKNLMVRYSWRPQDWEHHVRETVLTFEIEDLGVSRSRTGEGISLMVTHDGWSDQSERDQQEKLLHSAIGCLKGLLEGKRIKPWWDVKKANTGYQQIKLPGLKQFAEKIEKENRGKPDKKLSAQNIVRICQNLDGQGSWYIKENETEFELRFRDFKIFGVLKNGCISIAWRDLEKFLGKKSLKEMSNRMALEQDVDIHIGKSQEKISAHLLHVDLLTQWAIDVIQFARDQD